MAMNQPSWTLDGTGLAAINVDTGTDCLNDYVEIGIQIYGCMQLMHPSTACFCIADGASTQCNTSPNAMVTSRLCGLIFGAEGHTTQNFGMSTVCGKYYLIIIFCHLASYTVLCKL